MNTTRYKLHDIKFTTNKRSEECHEVECNCVERKLLTAIVIVSALICLM